MRKILENVVIIRLILIVLLVMFHAFAIYNGAWEMPSGITTVKAYYFIASLSYSFMLETFVFIAGYVLGYQTRVKYSSVLPIKSCLLRKAKRLLIPSVLFSLLYILCFRDISEYSVLDYIYHVVNGVGHMWFLPMLFLCFIFICITEKMKLSPQLVVIFAVIASLFSIGPLGNLPIRFSLAMYYFIYFAIGFYIQKYELAIERFVTFRNISLTFVSYTILFLLYHYVMDRNNAMNPNELGFSTRALCALLERVLKILQAFFGLITTSFLVDYLLKGDKIKPSRLMVRLSRYCFGVYIFQQFILMWCVKSPVIVNSLGSYAFPWVAFVVALVLSLLCTHVLLQTKIGRFLVG